MIKKITLGTALFASSMAVNAGVMTFDNTITGADMAGLEVVATFYDNSTETLLWQVISTDLGTSNDPSLSAWQNNIINHQGFVGGVEGTGWSLQQSGYTAPNFYDGMVLGAWSFVDNSQSGIKKLEINSNSTNIYFDTLLSDASGNGSGVGFDFIASVDPINYTVGFGDNLVDELYGSLILDLHTSGLDFDFLIDTDKLVDVPEPSSLAMLSIFALGLAGLARRRKVAK